MGKADKKWNQMCQRGMALILGNKGKENIRKDLDEFVLMYL